MFNAYHEDLTYWGPPAPDGSGGKTFDAPVAIRGRWEEVAEEVFSLQGKLFISKSCVWVSQEVEAGGYLYRGTSVATDPTITPGAEEIGRFLKTPDIRSMKFELRAMTR